VRDLADELAGASARRGGQLCAGREALALHLEVIHRLAKAALVGTLDPVVASSSAGTLTASLLARISPPPGDAGSSPVPALQAAAVLGQASRYAVPGPAANLGRGHPGVQPRRHRCVPQVRVCQIFQRVPQQLIRDRGVFT
jgi:hypothetical protein